MAQVGRRKIALFGFLAVLMVAIPASLYVISQQQNTQQNAEKATSLAFLPESSPTTPITKNIGDTIPLDINVDPGTNIVSFVKLEIQYDSSKIATAEADAFKVNDAAFPVTLEGPSYQDGKILVTLSVGSDPTKAIQTVTKAATITFKAIANTGDTPTNVTYGNTTEILSIGGNDQASENVLLNVNPAVITIGSATPSGGVTPSDSPTTAPNPTTPPAPTTIPPTAGPTGVGSSNQSPVCTALNLDRDTTGSVPYSVTFTAVGTDADGTISSVAFNYGDGPIETVTEAGGIGSNSVSSQKAHTYTNPGTYQAQAVLTDSNGASSDIQSCKKTIIVLAPTTAGGVGGGVTTAPSPTIAATGPGDVFLGMGAIAAIITVVGGLLFFTL
jgi:hypothetical protein